MGQILVYRGPRDTEHAGDMTGRILRSKSASSVQDAHQISPPVGPKIGERSVPLLQKRAYVGTDAHLPIVVKQSVEFA